jgi:hypothetical protein
MIALGIEITFAAVRPLFLLHPPVRVPGTAPPPL